MALVSEENVGSSMGNDLNNTPCKVIPSDKCKVIPSDKQLVQEETTNNSPSYLGKLEVDGSLLMSRKNYSQSIKALIQNVKLLTLDKVFLAPAYPMAGILGQFAEKVYSSKETAFDRDFEKQLKLPLGWRLLTCASNSSLNNGYFGAAFWHPDDHHVVIAHRGTDPSSIGALYTDFKGILFNMYASQMNSACTFVESVKNALISLNQRLEVNFQLFITGHSLGGWLAQVTTFTAKYLSTIEENFVKSSREGYHSHCVVFDSPGCKETLLQMQKDFDLCMDDSSLFIDSLDITSYLSAPNRINTCNSHVGIIYRIFPDLSQMTNLEKLTPLYNLATHCIDNILGVFDSKSGKILQDEFEEFRAQQVMDWPVSSGLDGGDEYILFFREAKSTNNYQPREGSNAVVNNYYETKPFTDKMCSLSVFTESEISFLERYLLLRNLPNVFDPSKIFSSIHEKNQLQNVSSSFISYNIQNHVIFCDSLIEMQKLIPLVKCILHFFPETHSNILQELTSFETIKNIFQSNSTSLLDSMEAVIDLEITNQKCQIMELEDLLAPNSKVQIHCYTYNLEDNVYIGIVGMYKAFITYSQGDNRYISNHFVFNLYSVLNLEKHVSLCDFLSSKNLTHCLVLMDCAKHTESSSEEMISVFFQKLFHTLREKISIKIILFTTKDDELTSCLKYLSEEEPKNCYIRDGGSLTWNDLGTNSKNALLSKSLVTFQGRQKKVSLVDLLQFGDSENCTKVSASDIIDSQTLVNLIMDREVVVGDALPTFGDRYYIERSLYRNKMSVKADILGDESLDDLFAFSGVESDDLIFKSFEKSTAFKLIEFDDAIPRDRDGELKYLLLKEERAEIDFQCLCKRFSEGSRPIHWLTKENDSSAFLWCKSQGSLMNLFQYKIETTYNCHKNNPVYNEERLISEKDSNVFLISGVPRMGKSAVLTKISLKIQEHFPLVWVVKINLKDGLYKKLPEDVDFKNLSLETAVEILWNLFLPVSTPLEKQLFKRSFYLPNSVTIIFDSLADVSLPYREKVIQLVKVFMDGTPSIQIWLTTNENLKDCFEKALGVISYSLVPFSEQDQIKFFNDFWKCKLNLNDVDKERVDILTDTLLHLLPTSMHEGSLDFTKVVLHIKMLGEVFASEYKSSFSNETEHDMSDSLNLVELYKTFISKKVLSFFSSSNFDCENSKVAEFQRDATKALDSLTVSREYSSVYSLFEDSPIYKFFQDSGMLTLLPCTKE